MATQHDMHNKHLTTEQLSTFLDKQGTPAEQVEWNIHLQTCLRCQNILADLRQTSALLHALPEPTLPHSFVLPTNVHYIQERLQPQDRPNVSPHANRGRYYLRTSIRAISTIVAILGLFFILSSALAVLPHGGGGTTTSSSGNSSSAQYPAPATQVPRISGTRGNSPSTNCQQNRSVAGTCDVTHQPSTPNTTPRASTQATAQPQPTATSTPTTSDIIKQPIVDVNTPQGHLELGSVLLLLGVSGIVLVRRKKRE